MNNTYIMAVDDDQDVLQTLGRVLRQQNYQVELIASPLEALVVLERSVPDLLILDIIMPEMSGVDLCRQLRADTRFSTLPILFLTAKVSVDDVVVGLDAGADDYITKPFEVAELRARVTALLRRGMRENKSDGTLLRINEITLDSDTYQVEVEGRRVQLTSTEHRLLRYLMENPNRALSPSHLLQAVWEYPPNTGDPDLVRAHVRNLRAKLDKGARKKLIRTIHGVGYMISTT